MTGVVCTHAEACGEWTGCSRISGKPSGKVTYVNYLDFHLINTMTERRNICQTALRCCFLRSEGQPRGASKLYAELKAWRNSRPHVADARTCCLNPATSTHRTQTNQTSSLSKLVYRQELIRISLGLARQEDLIADISNALGTSSNCMLFSTITD